MSEVYCWECEHSYPKGLVFDIPVFNKGYTIQWCLNCAMKQLKWTDYRLVPKSKRHKRFRIKSYTDMEREYEVMLDELRLCFEAQFRRIKDYDEVWGVLHLTVQDQLYTEGEDEGED